MQRSSPPHSQPTRGPPPPHSQPIQGPPPQRPVPTQGAIPPRVPQRQDIFDDDEDDDGGIDPKEIARRRQEQEQKKKKKEESKKKPQVDLDEEDDDGGVSKQKQIAAEKKKKELEAKKKAQAQIKARIDQDEDDDGGVSKQKQIAAEKKKKELEAKKKAQAQIKARVDEDNDEDDDGGPKRQVPTEKKKPVKKISKAEILKEEDEDDDGGRIVKTYDTIKMIMPKKQPKLDNETKKSPSPEANNDGSMLTSKRVQQQPLLASYDTVGRMVPKVSTDFRRVKQENHYDTIPTDEERAARASAIYSPPSYDQASAANDLNLLRTISYREAQESTPPLTTRRPTGTSSIHSHSNTNEDSSHYSEIINDAAQSGVINRSYSHTGSIRSASNHSVKQLSKQASPQALKEDQQTEESTIETEEEEEEEEEEDEEEEKPLKTKRLPPSNISTAYATITHLFKPAHADEINRVKRQKQARFRWFLAYTILNNYHLFDLRKQAQSRLALLRIQRSNLIDEEQQKTAAAVPVPQAIAITELPESTAAKKPKTRYAYLNKFYQKNTFFLVLDLYHQHQKFQSHLNNDLPDLVVYFLYLYLLSMIFHKVQLNDILQFVHVCYMMLMLNKRILLVLQLVLKFHQHLLNKQNLDLVFIIHQLLLFNHHLIVLSDRKINDHFLKDKNHNIQHR